VKFLQQGTGSALLVSALASMIAGCGGSGGGGGSPTPPSPAPIATVQIVSGDNQTGTVGTELSAPLVGTVVDAQGNALAGRVVNFQVATGGGAVFAGTATSDGSGVIRERWTLGTSAGAQRIEVRGVNSSGAGVVFANFNATATAAAAASVTAVAGTSGQTAGQTQALPAPISVRVADAYGNAKAGVTVNFVPCSTCGSANPTSAVTDASGIASASWTLGIPVGTQFLAATVIGVPGADFSATATRLPPGAPAHVLVESGNAQTIMQHQKLPQPLVARVTDAIGNDVPGATVTFEAEVGSPYVAPADINSDANGLASYLPYFHGAGNNRVAASLGGNSPATFDVSVAATAYDFDGDYDCALVNTSGQQVGSTTLVDMNIQNHAVTGAVVGSLINTIGMVTFDSATGAISGRIRYGLDGHYEWTGTLTLGPDLASTLTGTFDLFHIVTVISTGNMTCTRR
jgi:hypothetical protein